MIALNKLEELYQKRDTFLEFGSEVPEALATQIAEAEKEMQQKVLMPIIESSALKTLPPYSTHGKVLIALEYDHRSLTRIAITSDVDRINDFDVVKEVSPEADDAPTTNDGQESDEEYDKLHTHRSASIGFAVHFADGKVVHEKTAHLTMIEALRHMGLERASHFSETFKGYPLVGTKRRTTPDGYQWQRYVDGWWIYTNLTNERKIKCITAVGKMLHIPLKIVMEDAYGTVATDKPKKPKGKRAMYSLNGGPAFYKNRAVLHTVQQFLTQMPNATFKDVCDFFPSDLQGSYGVVRSLDDIERRKRQNMTEDTRWFLEPNEVLTDADGLRFAVSREWGNNFAQFQKHIAHELGWALIEAD